MTRWSAAHYPAVAKPPLNNKERNPPPSCSAADVAKLGSVCRPWRALQMHTTFSAWWDPPLDIMELILSGCSAADAARLRCVCKSWRAVLERSTQLHVRGRAEGSSRGIASPELQLVVQPLWSERGGLMPAGHAGDPSLTPQASLVRCAKHLQSSIANDLCDPPLAAAISLISTTLGTEVAHLVSTVTSCHDFSQHMGARSPALQQVILSSHRAAEAARAAGAGAAAVARAGGPLAARATAAAQAAKQAAIAAASAAAAAHDALTASTVVNPWGYWSALMLGMVCARNGHGVPSLASELWSMTELQHTAISARQSPRAPRFSRAQVRELLCAVLLLSRHREAGLDCANQLKPLHDMLLASTLFLESTDQHRAFAAMQQHTMMRGLVLPPPAFHLDTRDKPLTKEQVDIVQSVLFPSTPLPNIVHRIIAFAGTGKTTTLRLVALAYPTLRILYTKYNRDDDSQVEVPNDRFPNNVTRLTTCAIANRETKPRGDLGDPRKKAVKDYLESRLGPLDKAYKVVDIVLNTANTWMMSSDPVVTREHVPLSEVCELPADLWSLNFVKLAEGLYGAMFDPTWPEISTSHNAYVKKFVLGGARITSKSGGPFDAILLDEAQDVNQVTLQMLLAQPGTKILCGDPNQHIYSFNGCCDSLSPTGPFKDLTQGSAAAGVAAGGLPSQDPLAAQPLATQHPAAQAPATQPSTAHAAASIPPLRAMVDEQYRQGLSLTLTTSFRLGPEIAHVAGRLLADCCHEPRPLLAMGSADAVVFAPEVQNRVVHRFQQMPLLSTRNNERYPMGVSCLSIEASSKALALWRRSQAPSGTQFPLLPGPLGLDFCPPIVHTKTDAPLLYLARTNLGWFAAAVALAEKGMRFYVDPKGAYHDLCKRTRAVEALCIRNELEDSRLKMYRDENGPSFSCRRIHQAAEKGVLDGNFIGPFKIFQAWRERTRETLQLVESCREKKNKQAARFWLSTVHKVKGLETPYVQLANDFTKLSTPEERAQTPDDDTYLVYVAVTRATRMLFINSDLCWVQSPRVSQEPCPCLEVLEQGDDNENSTQLAPPLSTMSLLDVRQQSAADFQTLRCSALPTAWPHNPWMTLECATIGPWHRCGAPGCPRPWFRHREAPRISVCLRYSSPSPGETYEMCSACARSTIYGDLWGAC